MAFRGKDIFWLTFAGVAAYVAYRVFNYGDTIGEAMDRFWEGLTFDADTLGPETQLTPGAQLSQAEYIRRGFLEVLPDGRTRITPKGEEYIRAQMAREIQGEVVSEQ